MWSIGFVVIIFVFCFVGLSVSGLDESTSLLSTTTDTPLPHVAVKRKIVITCTTVPGTNNSIPVRNLRWLKPDAKGLVKLATEYSWEPIYQYQKRSTPNSVFLKFNSLTVDQGGIYRCLGDRRDGLLEASVEVLPFHEFAVTHCPVGEIKLVVRRTEGVIRCLVTGGTSPNITWYKDGVLFVPDSNRCKIEPPEAIKCDPVFESDAGNYTFVGSVSSPFEKVINRTFTVKTLSEPHIQNLTTEIQVAEHGTVRLTCSATGVPSPTYMWLDADLNEYKNQIGYRVNTTSGTLVISEVYRHDAGFLTCVAKNNVGIARRRVKLIVSTQPEEETTSPSLEQVTSSDLLLIEYVKKTYEMNRSIWKVILGLVVTVSILIILFIVDVSCYVTKGRGLMTLLVRRSWNGGKSANEMSL